MDIGDKAYISIDLDEPEPDCGSTCENIQCPRCGVGDCGEDALGNVQVILYVKNVKSLLQMMMAGLEDDNESFVEINLGVHQVSVHGLKRPEWFKPE